MLLIIHESMLQELFLLLAFIVEIMHLAPIQKHNFFFYSPHIYGEHLLLATYLWRGSEESNALVTATLIFDILSVILLMLFDTFRGWLQLVIVAINPRVKNILCGNIRDVVIVTKKFCDENYMTIRLFVGLREAANLWIRRYVSPCVCVSVTPSKYSFLACVQFGHKCIV